MADLLFPTVGMPAQVSNTKLHATQPLDNRALHQANASWNEIPKQMRNLSNAFMDLTLKQQDLENRAKSLDFVNKYRTQLSNVEKEYTTLKGKDMIDNKQVYYNKLNDIRRNINEELKGSNQAVFNAFYAQAENLRMRAKDALDGYVMQETVAYDGQVRQADIALKSDTLIGNYNSATYERYNQDLINSINVDLQSQGIPLDSDIAKNARKTSLSKIHFSTIEQYIENGDLQSIRGFIDRAYKSDQLLEVDKLRLEQDYKKANQTMIATAKANEINNYKEIQQIITSGLNAEQSDKLDKFFLSQGYKEEDLPRLKFEYVNQLKLKYDHDTQLSVDISRRVIEARQNNQINDQMNYNEILRKLGYDDDMIYQLVDKFGEKTLTNITLGRIRDTTSGNVEEFNKLYSLNPNDLGFRFSDEQALQSYMLSQGFNNTQSEKLLKNYRQAKSDNKVKVLNNTLYSMREMIQSQLGLKNNNTADPAFLNYVINDISEKALQQYSSNEQITAQDITSIFISNKNKYAQALKVARNEATITADIYDDFKDLSDREKDLVDMAYWRYKNVHGFIANKDDVISYIQSELDRANTERKLLEKVKNK